jgi:CDGSH-type Zn-finger protein
MAHEPEWHKVVSDGIGKYKSYGSIAPPVRRDSVFQKFDISGGEVLSQNATPSKSNKITLRANGPLICEGEFQVLTADGEVLANESELYLCRCGLSKKIPFCDGSHKKVDFDEGPEFHDERDEQLATTTGPVSITCRPNAMYVVKGQVTIQSEGGPYATTRSKAALCRCGASGNKPFCDASHKQCDFTTD